MKIFDCTTFYSEDLMLDVRFNILNEHVHKFVIVESRYSHSGKKKNLNFDINKFKKFKDKIRYVVIENEPEGLQEINDQSKSSIIKRMNSIKRVEQSYNYMQNGIKDASENDLIVLSDNDEIPNFNSKHFKNSKNDIYIFEQLFFHYKFNLFYDLIPWYGTKACKKKCLRSFAWLRNLKNKKYPFWRLDTLFSKNKFININIIKDGGWHFTNVKSPEDLFEKLSNYGHHNEFEDAGVTVEKLRYNINNRIVDYDHLADKSKPATDKLNRNYKLKIAENSFLPNYLILNKDKYSEWFD